MRSRIPELRVSRNSGVSIGSLLLLVAIFSLFSLSACTSSVPVISDSGVKDSLAEASVKEFAIASLLNTKGEYRGAAERYRKLLTAQPENAAIYYALSKAYVGLGVLDSARTYSEKSVLLNPGNEYYARFLAALAHQMHDYGRASDLYRKLAVMEPGSVEQLYNLATEYISADQSEQALAVFQEILALDPKNEAALVQSLLIELKLTHYQDAIGTLTALIGQGDGTEKLHLTLGELYLQTKTYDLASRTFRELLKENPGSVPAWLALFEASVQSTNHSAFLDDLNHFFDTRQVSLQQKIELAKLLLVRSSTESIFAEPAMVMIGEIIRRYPGIGQVYALRGIAQMQQRDAAAAAIDFRKALLLEPGAVEIWEEFITASLIQKEFVQAGDALTKVKKRFPATTLRLKLLEGEYYFLTGKIKTAALLLERVVQSKHAQKEKSLYLQSCIYLAFCYDALGYHDKSIRLYEIILDLDPDNTLMMNNLAYEFALQGKDLSRAKELAIKVVAMEPANAGYLDTLGWVLYMMGEYEKSRGILEKAMGLSPLESEIVEHLGKVYEKLGNLEKALEMKEKLRKLKTK
ncbi:MAG: tetratricopeptide repeat protein [Chlorobiaceae bacterium]